MPFTKLLIKQNSRPLLALMLEEIKRPIVISYPIILLFKSISTIQILALMLEIALQFFEHSNGRWGMTSLFRAFVFKDTFTFDSPSTVSSIAFIICCLIVLLNYTMLLCVFIGIQMRNFNLYRVSSILKVIMVLHHFVLFLPIHTFMLEVIKTCSESKFNLFSSSNDSLFLGVATVVLVLNFLIGSLSIKCYSSLYAQKTFTKRNANLAILDFLFKAGVSVYVVFTSSSSTAKWLGIAITLIYNVLDYYFFQYQLPFFQIKVLETYCVLLGARIAMGFSIFLIGIFDEFRQVSVPDLPLAAFLLSLPICIRGQFDKLTGTILKTLTFDERNYRTESGVFIHLLAIRYLFKKGAFVSLKPNKEEASKWNLALSGVIVRHKDTCFRASCGCKTFLELEDLQKSAATKKEKYKELKAILMNEMYEKGVERVPHSELILLNLAQFYLLYLENYLRSYLVLQVFDKKAHKAFETEILIEYLKKRVQERMELKLSGNGQQSVVGDYEPNNLNVTALVQNDILFIQLKKLVSEQVTKQLKFWDMLDNFELNTKAIETCCEEIDSVRVKIEKLWESLSKINQKCSSHYLLYGLYQTMVNNTTKRGERFLNDYIRMYGINTQDKEGITNDNLYDQSTVVIRISMRRDKIGVIEECSGDIDSTFGYPGSELVNSNVATLMSTFFKERHHAFCMNHFEKGTENVLNKSKRLYGLHRDGYIFPISLYVSIYPNIETGLSYIGIIRPRKVYNNYILVKSDGTVDSYSPEIAEYLGLESRKKYNIVELCPEFEKINNAFNYVTHNKYENIKEDAEHLKTDYTLKKRSNEYQLKISHADSPKLNDDQQSNSQKKQFSSIVSDIEGNVELNKMFAFPSLETKDEVTQVRPKEKSPSTIKLIKARNNLKKLKRLNTEDIEEYKRVYDQLSISGSVLSFVSQKEKMGTSLKNYLCTVSDEIFDYSVLRIITLGRNDANVDGENKDTEHDKGFTTLDLLENRGNITLSNREVLSAYEEEEVGISAVPRLEENELFKNPFVSVENLPDRKNLVENTQEKRESLAKFLKTNTDGLDTQFQRVTSVNGFEFDAQEKMKIVKSMNNSDFEKSSFTDRDNRKYKDALNNSGDFIQEVIQDGNAFNKSEISNNSHLSTRGGILSKLEALLYKKEESKFSNKLKAYFLIVGACFIFAISNTIINNDSLENGSQKVQKMLSVGERINVMLNLNFNARIVYLYINDYISSTRHLADKNINNFAQVASDNMRANAETLIKVNTAVMNDIYHLHEEFQPKFYANMVELRYPTDTMKANNIKKLDAFEAIHTIALSAFQASSQDISTLGKDSEDIRYILLNTMNDLYLEMTNQYKIYEDDLDETLSGTRSVTWSIAIVVFLIYILFLSILFRDLTSTHQDKIRFWNSLIKLDTVKNSSHKKMLEIIKENLEHSSNQTLLKKTLIEAKKREAKEVKTTKAKDSQANGFKKLKNYNLQNRSYLVVLPFLFVFCTILAFFIVTEVLVSDEMDNKRSYLQEIKQSESYYQLNLLTLNGIYEYVSEGGSTSLTGKPIEQTLETNLATLSRLGDFISSFKVRSDFDPRDFMQNNLCNMDLTLAEKSECYQDGNGINTQGLLGILTFAKETMESVMDFAKHSKNTKDDIQIVLKQNRLIALENELKYITQGFKILSQTLADSERAEQNDFESSQIAILLLFILGLTVINYIMVLRGFKKLDGQKFDNMKILRVLPTSMILESKMLKTYLLKSFKDDLSSITNKL